MNGRSADLARQDDPVSFTRVAIEIPSRLRRQFTRQHDVDREVDRLRAQIDRAGAPQVDVA